MLGPYTANKDGTISYRGNKIFEPRSNIQSQKISPDSFSSRVQDFRNQPYWTNLSRINHRINIAANEYFNNLGALSTSLPLTTRMISSPGAVYGKEAINYTTNTCPITIEWFDLPKRAFLSESSQIYLELALMQPEVNQVYSIYNSFRKEKADATHLSEFHHIEYEGHINQKQNEQVALGLVKKVVFDLFKHNHQDMAKFLEKDRLNELETMAQKIHKIPIITYQEAQKLLFNETKNEKYTQFTMQDRFGAWEEIKLTEILGEMVAIREFPLLEVPFYHARVDGVEHEYETNITIPQSMTSFSGSSHPTKPLVISGKKKSFVADNTDIIWPGYRETIGSGHRVRSKEELEEKAKIFQLPIEDYQPYLQTRKFPDYKESSGFGLGWERMLQGMLEMPFIWDVCHFPRVDNTLKP